MGVLQPIEAKPGLVKSNKTYLTVANLSLPEKQGKSLLANVLNQSNHLINETIGEFDRVFNHHGGSEMGESTRSHQKPGMGK